MPKAEDILTPEDVATRLKLTPDQVIAAAERGEIRGFRIAGHWRFSAAQLAATLAAPDPGAVRPPVDPALPRNLPDLLPASHIVPELAATTGPGVIFELASAARQLDLVTSETWFAGALAERESMMSTAVEGGVAFLHARQTQSDFIRRPFVLLGRSGPGVAFGAPDGRPTHLFFTLGLKYDRLHLRWLSRLARLLRAEGVLEALAQAPDAATMHTLLLGEDAATPR